MKNIKEKLEVLAVIADKLNENNITWAIGASSMLYLRNIVQEFDDLDLLIKQEDALKAKEILLKMGTLKESVSGSYATKYFYEFLINGVEVDVMAGFKIVKDDIIYDCSLKDEDIKESVIVNGINIPLDSLENWLYYYRLMERAQKVSIIENHIKNQ
ncbi:MAG: hypothetical protein QM204_02075 [Bacillota bacterium]|jgi:hypothetical protein|nr:hypothetical protein [Bacillota bacterium]NLL26090.1 hypothetical protein [Erysipelotrichia bacterium]